MALNDKQLRFVEEYVIDHNAARAARSAGYSERCAKAIGSRLLTNVDVSAAVASLEQGMAEERSMTRDKAIAGILEGIAMAKEQGNPMAQISGWREIGKMLGFYAPERHTVKLSAEGRVLRSKYAAMPSHAIACPPNGYCDCRHP